jgi:hypothetical protein
MFPGTSLAVLAFETGLVQIDDDFMLAVRFEFATGSMNDRNFVAFENNFRISIRRSSAFETESVFETTPIGADFITEESLWESKVGRSLNRGSADRNESRPIKTENSAIFNDGPFGQIRDRKRSFALTGGPTVLGSVPVGRPTISGHSRAEAGDAAMRILFVQPERIFDTLIASGSHHVLLANALVRCRLTCSSGEAVGDSLRRSHFYDTVRSTQNSASIIQCLTSIRPTVCNSRIGDRKSSFSFHGSLRAPWGSADVAPIQTPGNVWYWDADRPTIQNDGLADGYGQLALRKFDDLRLNTSLFVAAVKAIILSIAMKTGRNTLRLRLALIFIGSAGIPWSFLSAIPFIRSIAAIVVPVAEPHFLDASAVDTLIFVGFAGFRRSAIVFVGSVAAIPIAVAKIFRFYALPIPASFFVWQALAGGSAPLLQGTVWIDSDDRCDFFRLRPISGCAYVAPSVGWLDVRNG